MFGEPRQPARAMGIESRAGAGVLVRLAAVAVVAAVAAACAFGPPLLAQPASGDGWRLLGSATAGSPYSVAFVDNLTDFEAQLAGLGIHERLTVDFDREAVLVLTAAVSGSCPEIRFDGLRREPGLLHGVFADAFQLRPFGGACTADANPHTFLLAVDRTFLPERPFTLRLEREIICHGCEGSEETIVR